MNCAVFLDRDGTINVDPGYLSDPAMMELLPGAARGLKRLKDAGYMLIVVTNQSGVDRGIIRPEALVQIHERLNELLRAEGVEIDHFQICTHLPTAGCACRKPNPMLLEEAAQRLGLSLSCSYMVGDKISDLEAGRNAHCRGVALVRTGYGPESLAHASVSQLQDFTGDGLEQVADWILSSGSANS